MGADGSAGAKLIVDRASKQYATKTGAVHALEDYSMAVAEGELVCVLGPSGCGKSTLLWAMAGLHSLTGGQVLLDGEPVTQPHPAIGMVFQGQFSVDFFYLVLCSLFGNSQNQVIIFRVHFHFLRF